MKPHQISSRWSVTEVLWYCETLVSLHPSSPAIRPHSPSASHLLFVCLCWRMYVCVRPCPSTAVISAHPIHSLDNHHHHYHMGSLASPTRSYLYHQGGGHPRPHACTTPISHLDRVDSTGEVSPHPFTRPLVILLIHSHTTAISLTFQFSQSFSPTPPSLLTSYFFNALFFSPGPK